MQCGSFRQDVVSVMQDHVQLFNTGKCCSWMRSVMHCMLLVASIADGSKSTAVHAHFSGD